MRAKKSRYHRSPYLMKKVAAGFTAITLFVSVNARSDPFELTFEEVAPGVWTGIRDDSVRLPVTGNAIFVISDAGVVVFDGGSVPLMSERLIAKIRELTSKPVTHVAISHWHGDHNLGIFRFLEEFPSVNVIGHPFTRAAMLGSNMDYARKLDRAQGFLPVLTEIVETGLDTEGNPVSEATRQWYREVIADGELIDQEYRRGRITPPNLTFEDKLVVHSGKRQIEFRYLGDANTAGDIVMWLPEEKIVATGDMVVAPTPYAFNMPPRKWAQTLRKLNALEYGMLIPGHGEVQRDTAYVDLLIESADSIADQRDRLLARGLGDEGVMEQLDYSAFRERYTKGNELWEERFDEWFAGPLSAAAIKELKDEPMVAVGPSTYDEDGNLVEKED